MNEVKASIAGSIWKIVVSQGEQVEAGQDIVILESMKMEIPIASEGAGTVKELKVAEGDFVNEGDTIAVIEERTRKRIRGGVRVNFPSDIIVNEVGPRDGLQNETKLIPLEATIEPITMLSATGH